MKNNKLTVEKLILFLAAGFAAYNFGLTGGYIEGSKFSVGGLIAGVVVNVSVAIASSRYASLNGNKRVQQARLAFVAMLVLSPMLVSPVIYYSLPETFLGAWWLKALWSLAWPLVADLAIVLAGAVSGKGLIPLSEDTKPQSEGTGESSGAGKPTSGRSAKKKARPAEVACAHAGAGCERMFASQNAANAHSRTCEFKPTISMPVDAQTK
jgi:hypothetical protein